MESLVVLNFDDSGLLARAKRPASVNSQASGHADKKAKPTTISRSTVTAVNKIGENLDAMFETVLAYPWTKSSLAWKDVRRIRQAADYLSACSMYGPAFRLHHYLIWRLSNDDELPEEYVDRMTLRELIACVRAAISIEDLDTVRQLLETDLHQRSGIDSGGRRTLILTLLAEVCATQGSEDAALRYQLEAVETLPRTSFDDDADFWSYRSLTIHYRVLCIYGVHELVTKVQNFCIPMRV